MSTDHGLLRVTFTTIGKFFTIANALDPFDDALDDFLRRCRAGVMLRGLRTLSDIEAEFSMTLANRALAPEIETVFLMASERYTHISSTLIKQVAMFGTNVEQAREPLEAFVPREVIAAVRAKFVK